MSTASYSRQAKEIVTNVLAFFKSQDDGIQQPKRTPIQNTVLATGVSRATVFRINGDGATEPKTRGPKRKRIIDDIDAFDRGVIRRLISQMYTNKTWPTVCQIHEKVKDEIGFDGSEATLRNFLKQMGYKYTKRPTRKFVKERPDIVAKRHEYLLKIQKIRQLTDCQVIYLDETFLHQNQTVSRCWTIDGKGGFQVPSGKGKRWIILHAGSKDGFVPGAELIFQSKSNSPDYHDEMNGEVFINWFKHQPNIPANSCIVMDNAPYHSMQTVKIPNMSSRKDAMQGWLTANNIPWESSMIKVQLYTLIQRHKPRCTSHVIDELARQHGHYIHRLPPYHCELNPIELIWAQIKYIVAVENSNFKMSDVHALLKKAISNISPEKWQACERHVIKLEEKLFRDEVMLDTTLPEDQLNTFRFYLSDDSSDEDEDMTISQLTLEQ